MMAPKSSQNIKSSQSAASQKKTTKVTKLNTRRLDVSSAPSKRINPLTAFSNIPASQLVPQVLSQSSSKGKGKARVMKTQPETQLWVDMYEPHSEEELAVHIKKVAEVRGWLNESYAGIRVSKYRRILVLTGPAGTAKTTTIRVLARELGVEVMEWRNSISDTSSFNFDNSDSYASTSSEPYPQAWNSQGHFSKFQEFMARASSCQNIHTSSKSKLKPAASTAATRSRRLILLEEFPNILHADTRSQFHEIIEAFVQTPQVIAVPIVVVVSDSGGRGEASDQRLAIGNWDRDNDGTVDIRTVLPRSLLPPNANALYASQIRFNPISITLLRKALQNLVGKHFVSPTSKGPSKEVLDVIIESANGDIRSAIMALQFACIIDLPSGRKSGTNIVLESITRREQSLALFHLMGKILYNKRKGDPPNSVASKRKEEEKIDARLVDDPNLPSYLAEHKRRRSRVNIDARDSPVDSSLFSLYIHQNYTNFCNQDLASCEGVAEWLSYVDSSGGEAWYQANPHQFHLLGLGTLHSLPSPVIRESQKFFKPDFFEYLEKEKNVWEAIRDVRGWFADKAMGKDGTGWRCGGWSNTEIAIESGAVLKARSSSYSMEEAAPSTYLIFAHLPFSIGSRNGRQLGEDDKDDNSPYSSQGGAAGGWRTIVEDDKGKAKGGWLQNDDIEDF